MIIISSKVEGYRRCGVQHPLKATKYPDEQFSPAELELLQQTPLLEVQVIQEEGDGSDNGGKEPRFLKTEELETMTVNELKARAQQLGLEVASKWTKPQIIERLVLIPLPESFGE